MSGDRTSYISRRFVYLATDWPERESMTVSPSTSPRRLYLCASCFICLSNVGWVDWYLPPGGKYVAAAGWFTLAQKQQRTTSLALFKGHKIHLRASRKFPEPHVISHQQSGSLLARTTNLLVSLVAWQQPDLVQCKRKLKNKLSFDKNV